MNFHNNNILIVFTEFEVQPQTNLYLCEVHIVKQFHTLE
jgi:hypothetical protein